MRFLKHLFYVSVVGLFVLTSCAKEESEPFDKYENMALKAWVAKYRPTLLENIQADGAYYVDIIEAGDRNAAPVNDTICWVIYEFTGRDLSGDIILSRLEADAKLSGTFTKYTHYVPFYRYCGVFTNMPVEGTHLAMRNTLTLGNDYFEANKDRLGIDKPEILLREGSVVDLYLPSRVVGNGLEGEGGYEGQYTLNDRKPLIVRMAVRDTVKNPLAKEGGQVDKFAEEGGGLQIFDKDKNKRPEKLDDPKHPYNSPQEWVNACDSVPQIYVNFCFKPSETLKFQPQTIYKSAYLPYVAFNKLEQDISEALVKRFYPDPEKPYVGVKELTDSVTVDGTAKIWYIGRFLDGFIFDTNIDEVKELIYGETASKGTALSYKPSDGGMITAFYYTIPNLRYGQWAAMITTSTNGYGASGKAGTTNTSGNSGYSSYYNYGGMGGYGGYYGDYYGGYNGGYYGNYGYGGGMNYGNIGSQETKRTVSTEIPPFTPLIFEIYVEPKEKK